MNNKIENKKTRKRVSAWRTGGLFPDDDTTVLLRLDSAEWPIVLGFRDGGRWCESDASLIDVPVLGWMDLHDAAEILGRRQPLVSKSQLP